MNLKDLLFKLIYRPRYEFERLIYNPYIRSKFNLIGKKSYFTWPIYTHNPKMINIGNHFFACRRLRIEAFDVPEYSNNKIKIEIGDGVNINWDCHIGACNKVKIGNGVLLASKVYISDHYHGEINNKELSIPPAQRKIWSKGPVVIEDNVWIGEGVAILPGVTIGENSIIGANSVVTKTIPPNSVAVGSPAKVIRTL